mgnify:CR=1 FL=1
MNTLKGLLLFANHLLIFYFFVSSFLYSMQKVKIEGITLRLLLCSILINLASIEYFLLPAAHSPVFRGLHHECLETILRKS